jgi:hypothetical protein
MRALQSIFLVLLLAFMFTTHGSNWKADVFFAVFAFLFYITSDTTAEPRPEDL